MLNRFTIAAVVLLLSGRTLSAAQDHDYLQRGQEERTAEYQIKYDRALRGVLGRGWRKDVVVRMTNIPPFQPESVAGIARTAKGYVAFDATAPKNIWYELGFGSDEPKRKTKDYRGIRPILHERPLTEALSTRVATLWRRVLTDAHNYGKDPSGYLDTDQFFFYLSFLPHERVSAYMTAWGPHTWQLIGVAAALSSYSAGAPERELAKAVSEAERKLGI
jgi:hypothetical protein